MVGPDLGFHGDRELGSGLVDLAVNVRLGAPPPWLAEVIGATVSSLGAYPDPSAATAAIAAHHGVAPECVLPTAGGAEAFTLVARAGPWRRPLVVHPQFTEPEGALRAAGYAPERLVLAEAAGFVLDPARIPCPADLVVIGNPTNPTGVLHPRAALRELVTPGRVLVVDEAFMDAVPGEPATLLDGDLSGVLVLRSLTKTWGLAGLRAGYVVGDPALIERLRAHQPPWSVSAPALAAMVAICSERGRREGAAAAIESDRRREHLVAGLARLGLRPATPDPRTPFVLVEGPPGLRVALRERGHAVRRGDTFPGLGPQWIRIAVRDPEVTDAFLRVLEEALVTR